VRRGGCRGADAGGGADVTLAPAAAGDQGGAPPRARVGVLDGCDLEGVAPGTDLSQLRVGGGTVARG